ncbi:hypothetical protein M407DRAFT_51327, partial [Tulasnella calospora MUT 4182]
DVLKGVEYLHTRQPPICHGDLKSLNVLVNSSYHAVITDFGSARSKLNTNAEEKNASELTLTGPLYTLRWAAPEVLAGEESDLPSDMWAVGWICWEIVTGKMPFEELHLEGPIVWHVVKGKLP